MKVRAAELLTPEQEARLAALTRKQIVALRFASDAELGELVDRAARGADDAGSDQASRQTVARRSLPDVT